MTVPASPKALKSMFWCAAVALTKPQTAAGLASPSLQKSLKPTVVRSPSAALALEDFPSLWFCRDDVSYKRCLIDLLPIKQ
jgi:hypothetical protein